MERDDRDLEKARATEAQREGLCVSKNSWFPVAASAPGPETACLVSGWALRLRRRPGTKPFPYFQVLAFSG